MTLYAIAGRRRRNGQLRQIGRPAGAATLVSLATMFLTGCAHNWIPGSGQSVANLERTKAHCSYVSRHGGGGFSARGSSRDVAIATAA
jgi:hypothetical protein